MTKLLRLVHFLFVIPNHALKHVQGLVISGSR